LLTILGPLGGIGATDLRRDAFRSVIGSVTILRTTKVDQTIDRDERGAFVKELVVARSGGSGRDEVPLAMVRKRSALEDGTRAPVVLIHGYGQNRYAWHLPSRSFSNYLARAGFDVFNLELRGHGRSRHLGARRPSHVADFVREDVPAAIEEVQRLSGGRPVYLVGHSLGGLVSYASAPSLGSAVAGVITLGSPYHFTRGSWALTALGDAMLAFDRRVHLGEGALALKGWGEAVRLARVLVESPIFPLPIRGFAPGSMEPAVLSQHMSLAMDQGSITVLRNMFRSAAEARRAGHRLGGLTGYASDFEAMNLPLLVIAGSRDDLAPPASVEPAYERSSSVDKAYRVFPRGHIDLIMGRDAPQTVWPLVESWLGARLRRPMKATGT
jgi:alpha-beta hydrolase superfamily lysophospholipase